MKTLLQNDIVWTTVAGAAVIALFGWVLAISSQVAAIEANAMTHYELPAHPKSQETFVVIQKQQTEQTVELRHLKQRQDEQFNALNNKLSVIENLLLGIASGRNR